MSERPFMQLFVADFLGDTMHLSTEQVGAYLLLLMALWRVDGSLPDDPTKLARVARVTMADWPSVWSDLASYFTIADGKLSQDRLTKELAKFARKSSARSAAGKLGAQAKALKKNNPPQAIASGLLKHSSETRIKKRANDLNPTEESVDVNRHVHPELFAACVEITKEPVPSFMEHKHFPAAVVEQARKQVMH